MIGVVAIVTTLQPVEYTATASVEATTTSKSENNAANKALFMSSKLAGKPTFNISFVMALLNL